MFWDDWLRIWNRDFAPAEQVIDPSFTVHATMMDGSSSDRIRGPEGLTGWIQGLSAPFHDMRFETVVGPIVDGPLIAGHWRASGTYAGGLPGATAAPGTPFVFTGTDVLRLQDGKAVEYWLVSDTLALLGQLGAAG